MNTESSNTKSTFISEVLDFLKSLAILLVIYLVIKTYIAQPFIVRGQSMEENFQDGDYLVVDELSYRFREPNRGEVVVFNTRFISSTSRGEFYIKRLIGLPGERVVIDRTGTVRIFSDQFPDGLTLEEPYLSPGTDTFVPEVVDITLGEDEFFVMGDNRDNSSDSRVWGALPLDYIVGKPFVRLYPLGDLTLYTQETFTQMAK